MPKSFLQTDIWGAFRESQGWYAHKVGDILVLERRLPFNRSFLYSPEVIGEPEILLSLLPEIFKIAKRRQAIFYRLELLVDSNTPLAEQWRAAFTYTGFQPAFESVQPNDRQIVPLTTSEQTVLSHMKQKGRYNIRLAEKSGVLVREASTKTLPEDVATFYSIFEETAKRDKFSIRPKSYFETLCETLYHHNCGRLFIATYQDIPVAAAIITFWDDTASYLYGASSNQHRHVMAPYALHWTVMQWAMSHEASQYDLLAIRPQGTQKHVYDGITRFKQQFGGDAVHLLGGWDLVLEDMWYTLFKLAEKVRR